MNCENGTAAKSPAAQGQGLGIKGLRGGLILYVLFLLIPILSTVIPLDSFNDMLAQSTLAPIFQSDGFFAQVIAGKIRFW